MRPTAIAIAWVALAAAIGSGICRAQFNSFQAPVDQTVSQVYKAEDGLKIEVEGTCRLNGNAVECWGPDGNAHPALTQAMEAAKDRKSSWRGLLPIFPTESGKKNRLVIFKITQAPGPAKPVSPGPEGSIFIESVGTHRNAIGAFEVAPVQPGLPTRYLTKQVSEDSAATTATAWMDVREPLKGRPTLSKKIGSTVGIYGGTYSLKSIDKGNQLPGVMPSLPGGEGHVQSSDAGDRARTEWTVWLKGTFTSNRIPPVQLALLDASGHVIEAVDDNGKPISLKEATKRGPGPEVLRGVGGRGSDAYFVIGVDPAYVSKLQLWGTSSKVVAITGIRLDPK